MRAAGSDWEVVGVKVTARFMKFVVVVNCVEMGSDMSAANQQRLRCSRLAVENKIGFHRCLLCNVLHSFTLFVVQRFALIHTICCATFCTHSHYLRLAQAHLPSRRGHLSGRQLRRIAQEEIGESSKLQGREREVFERFGI